MSGNRSYAGPYRRLACCLVLLASSAAASDLPKTTHDGLELLEHAKAKAAYAMPGATLEPYVRLKLLDCYVAFAKDWQKEFNREALSLDRRVSNDDMERMKKDLADEFREIFTRELEEEGGYQIVDEIADDVLILRPAIINLQVTAPDVGSAGFSRTFVSSVGQMTLFLELYDAPSGAILARIIDPESGDLGIAMQANRATNKMEADRILRRWADLLRDALDDARESMKKSG